MKKALVVLFAVCFMVLGATLAKADTRTDSLGLSAGQQVDDLDGIWLFPQQVASFGNVFDNRLGTSANNILGGLTPTQDWFGVIAKEWDDIGYIGVYTKRPFDQSNLVAPSQNPANNNGILNGGSGIAGNGWLNALNPAGTNGAINGTTVGDFNGNIQAQYFPVFIPAGIINDPENKLDAFWAKSFDNMTLGVHINYASQDATGNDTGTQTYIAPTPAGSFTTTSSNFASQVLGLDLGLGVKNVVFDNLDLALGFSMGSINDIEQYTQENAGATGTVETTNASLKDNGISELRLNALGGSKVSDATQGRAFLSLRLDNLGIATNSHTTSTAGVDTAPNDVSTQTMVYSDTNINIGYALDHKLADGKALVVVGLTGIFDTRHWTDTAMTNANGSNSPTLLFNNSGQTEDETTIAIPLNAAVEAPVWDWMKARIGVWKNVYQSVTTKIVEPTNINAGGTAFQTNQTAQLTTDGPGQINTYCGVGILLGNFTLDFQVSPTNLLAAFNGFSPGQGLVYGTANNNPQVGSLFQQLENTITQFDFHYAF